jgi:hypothetical protein
MDLPSKPFSPIYLGNRIKRAAGLPENPLDALLERTEREFPVVSQEYSRMSDGSSVRSMPSDSPVINDYRAVSYDLLLGRGFAEKIVVPDQTTLAP